MLETSRADIHKSGVCMQPAANTPTTSTLFVSLHRPRAPKTRSSQMSSHLYLYSAFNNTDCVKALNSIKLEDRVLVM